MVGDRYGDRGCTTTFSDDGHFRSSVAHAKPDFDGKRTLHPINNHNGLGMKAILL